MMGGLKHLNKSKPPGVSWLDALDAAQFSWAAAFSLLLVLATVQYIKPQV